MDRRKFLKILSAASLSAAFAPVSTFARAFPEKMLIAVKSGKYPGRIKPINEAALQKRAKWLG